MIGTTWRLYLLPYLHYDSPGMAPLGVDEYVCFCFGISITMPPVGISPQLGETSLDYQRTAASRQNGLYLGTNVLSGPLFHA